MKSIPPKTQNSPTPINVEEEIKAIRRTAKAASKSKEAARAFLVKAGLVNKDGTLREEFR